MTTQNATRIGERVGHIRIVEPLAHGGMGEVYVGFDETLKRRVALKAIRRRDLGKPGKRQRFLREARILSRLDHPNICRIFDYIEGDEQDFLVLELIEGESFANQLPTGFDHSAKLGLVRQMAEALAAAHAQGVVHRDLKPGNVMLTSSGVVKVLDFGIAGAVNSSAEGSDVPPFPEADEEGVETTDFSEWTELLGDTAMVRTADGVLLGTPGYMSPEQVRGEPFTAASDIYTLGLLFQEILTGQAAYDRNLPLLVQLRKIHDGEALPVEGLDAHLTRLIEEMKSLEPAVRPTAREIVRRLEWIRERPRRRLRHLALAALALFLLLGGFKYTYDLRRERSNAMAARQEAEEVVSFLVDLFEVSEPGRARGETVTARELLDDGAKNIRRDLNGQPSAQARLMDTIGNVYLKLGLFEEAKPLLEDGFRIRQEVMAEPVAMAESLNSLAVLYSEEEDFERAVVLLGQAAELLIEALGPESLELASVLNETAIAHEGLGDFANAEKRYRESLTLRQRLLEEDDPVVAISLNNLGLVRLQQDDVDEAKALLQRALEISERRLPANHPELAVGLNNLAILHYQIGEYAQAAPLMERDLAISQEVYGEFHPDVATSLSNLAVVYSTLGDFRRASEFSEQSVRALEEVFGAEHPRVASVLGVLGRLQRALGDLETAEATLRRALTILETSQDLSKQVQIFEQLALVHRDRGRLNEATTAVERALESGIEVFGAKHSRVGSLSRTLGELQLLGGKLELAAATFEEALKVSEAAVGADHPEVAASLALKGKTQRFFGDLEGARKSLEQALMIHREGFGADHLAVQTDLLALAQLDLAEGDLQTAEDRFSNIVNWTASRVAAGLAVPEEHELGIRAQLGLGAIWKRHGKREEAMAALQKAVEDCRKLAKENSLVVFQDLEIQALAGLGRVEEASALARPLLESGWLDVDLLASLGAVKVEASREST